MRAWKVMLVAMALVMAVSAGHAVAGPGESDWGGVQVGTVRFIDRQLNLIQLNDGTEFYTRDARMLKNLQEGMRVKVDYVHGSDNRNELNSVEPVGADTPVSDSTSPTTG